MDTIYLSSPDTRRRNQARNNQPIVRVMLDVAHAQAEKPQFHGHVADKDK